LQRARISVVPLLYGAGTKRKLMQSLMVGTPCVSTSIGIEGLDLVDETHVLVADDAVKFAADIERLLTDEELWLRLQLEGRERVVSAHGRESVRAVFDSVLSQIMSKAPRRLKAAAAHA
jgi:glycosyltransferase involved in cell wall biosynthesis